MKVAVLTLTRDRLAYTRHCFASLRENAGCDFDHFVLDQASEDGTRPFLHEEYECEWIGLKENVGIHRGWNILLDAVGPDYDVYVTFDNDCEVTTLGTLAACAKIAARGDWIVSPTVNGLNFPPVPWSATEVDGELIGVFRPIGGIFRAMPGSFASRFRFNESNPHWGGDENDVAARFPGQIGYLLDWSVNHYETTRGQEERYPRYFERKLAEMAA